MIQYNPFLKLNRLVIFTNDGKIAYDEQFNYGINIIRGQNSSGKSTIANFIFYVLGGDFNKWTTAALRCRDVFAEIEINSVTITLKRVVSENKYQPMSIFFGNYEKSKASGSEGWQIYSYKRNENKKSFSNALFLALGLPELRGDVDSNITMHQILRLVYIDQKSLTQDLLLTESFDSSITRSTISELLFGVYDDTLYSDRLELRENEKDFEVNKRQFEGIESILKSAGSETNSKTISEQLISNEKELAFIEESILNLEKKEQEKNVTTETHSKLELLQNQLLENRRKQSILQSQISELDFEINDSSEFIRSLEKRAIALEESLLTRNYLGSISLTHCPHCLSVLEPIESDNQCILCKQIIPGDESKSQIKRMQQEIDNQIRESKKLLKVKETSLLELKASYPAISERTNSIEYELRVILSSIKTEKNEQLEKMYMRKGELKSDREYLIKQLKAIEQIEVLRNSLEKLNARISYLKSSIYNKIQQQNQRLEKAYQIIEGLTLHLLKSDLGRQPEFSRGKHVELDFNKNTYSLDGENNFSESSNIYLKNSVRFAVFFASLAIDFFRYPRVILCDNIEDKGMEEIRSQSFQKAIVELSKNMEFKHQIIFSTSMIAPELNAADFCVGEFYSKENKTLKNIN